MTEISIGVPFTKINKEERTVVGIATADNLDLSGDVITPEATLKAFNDWIGNIREMHKPNAVGRAVTFRPVQVPHQGRMYNAMELKAYVSKGAQDTWEKVLDGTLKGFSIGGKIDEATKEFRKDINREARVIKKYSLQEISLVDNPCNPAALITMVKMADNGESTYELDMLKYQVYYCPQDNTAHINQSECQNGHACDLIGQVDEIDLSVITKMVSESQKDGGFKLDPSYAEDNSVIKLANSLTGGNKLQENNKNDNVDSMSDFSTEERGALRKLFGWVMGEDYVSKSAATADATSSTPTINIYTTGTNTGDGLVATGANTGTSGSYTFTPEVTKAACAHDQLDKGDTCPNCGETMTKAKKKPDESESVDNPAEEELEKSEDTTTEEGDNEMDLEKFMTDLSVMLDDKLSKAKEDISSEVDEKIAEIQKSVDEKLGDVEERVETVESTGAVKKSADEEADDEGEIEKSTESESFWKGIFVHPELVKSLGYDS